MRTFFVLLCLAAFGIAISSCEKRARRQIWGAPPNDFSPENFLPDNDDEFFEDPSSSWRGPQPFGQPMRNPNEFQFGKDDFFFDGSRNDRNQNNRQNQNNRENQNNRRNQNQNQQGNNQNQNRRTTTQSPGPITSAPTTLHHAPQGCPCSVTQQFNPVCGTDGNTYKNKGLLNCYVRCGTSVSQKRLGAC